MEERHVESEDDGPVFERVVVPRDFNIMKEHLETFGYSEDCGRCRVLSHGGNPSMHHTKKCRERIRKCLTESGKSEVLRRAEDRQSEYIASQVQAASEVGDSAVFGGSGVPGSSNQGGVISPPAPQHVDTLVHHDDSGLTEGARAEAAAAELPPVPDSDIDEDPRSTRRARGQEEHDEHACSGKRHKRSGKNESDSQKEKRRKDDTED